MFKFVDVGTPRTNNQQQQQKKTGKSRLLADMTDSSADSVYFPFLGCPAMDSKERGRPGIGEMSKNRRKSKCGNATNRSGVVSHRPTELGPTMLDFSDRTGTGIAIVV
jgi:hypothetical protein